MWAWPRWGRVLGGGSMRGAGLDRGALGGPQELTFSVVEGFSGYAVRYLKPEVTQNWRVRTAAPCRDMGAQKMGWGWEGEREVWRYGRPRAGAVWGVGGDFLSSSPPGSRTPATPVRWPAAVLHQPEPQPGPLWTEAPALRIPVSQARALRPQSEGGWRFPWRTLRTLEGVRPAKQGSGRTR